MLWWASVLAFGLSLLLILSLYIVLLLCHLPRLLPPFRPAPPEETHSNLGGRWAVLTDRAQKLGDVVHVVAQNTEVSKQLQTKIVLNSQLVFKSSETTIRALTSKLHSFKLVYNVAKNAHSISYRKRIEDTQHSTQDSQYRQLKEELGGRFGYRVEQEFQPLLCAVGVEVAASKLSLCREDEIQIGSLEQAERFCSQF